MAEASTPFDWDDLDQRFRNATSLPNFSPDDENWWTGWHQHVATRSTPVWFYNADTSPEWFAAHWPALTKTWIEAAEKQLEDPKNAQFRPERLPNGDIDWGGNSERSMSWGGLHYWAWANPIIRGYGLTRDEKFVAGFADHLRGYFEQVDTFVPTLWTGANLEDRDWRDWITHNDLSAGIKMATFAEAVMVFARSAMWTVEDLKRATLLLLRLAERLYDTYKDAQMSADFLRTKNFLTSGAAGLGVVAAIFPECAWSANWHKVALCILEVHVMELYYSDGGHKELCTQYHKSGMRDVLFLEQVLAKQDKSYFLKREPYRTKMRDALRWLTGVLMPNGTTSVLNSAAASTDWLAFVLVANSVLQDPELNWHVTRWFSAGYIPRQKSIPANCARIIGEGNVPDIDVAEKPNTNSVLFPETGVAVLRSGWHRWASTMVLDFGRPIGGHAYPARGSLSLYLKGKPAALSPGSPHAYTDPDYRGWMHTSLSQNNVLIDDLDQESWVMPGVRRVHGEICQWATDVDSALVQGYHEGYLNSVGIGHWRTVKMLGDVFLVYDVLDAEQALEDHVAKWSIHCPEKLAEGSDRIVQAEGLMRVVPAYPEQIDVVVFGQEGKAVMPIDAEDGRTDAHQTLFQARWCQPILAGQRCEFLMAIAPDDVVVTFVDVTHQKDVMLVQLCVNGVRDTICLPVV